MAKSQLETDGTNTPQPFYLQPSSEPQKVWYLRCLAKLSKGEMAGKVPHIATLTQYKELLGLSKAVKKIRFGVRFRFKQKPKRGGKARDKQPMRASYSQHEKTFKWGGVHFTFIPEKTTAKGRAPPAYFCTCVSSNSRHKNPLKKKTGCTRRRSFVQGDGASEQKVINQLKAWLLAHENCATRADHQKYVPAGAEIAVAAHAEPPAVLKEVDASLSVPPNKDSKRQCVNIWPPGSPAVPAVAQVAARKKGRQRRSQWKSLNLP